MCLGRGATFRHHSTEANARRAATTGTGITATGHGDNIPPRGTKDPVSPAADTTMPVTPSAAGAAFPLHSTGAPATPAATIMMLRTASAMSRFPTTGQHIASIAQPAGKRILHQVRELYGHPSHRRRRERTVAAAFRHTPGLPAHEMTYQSLQDSPLSGRKLAPPRQVYTPPLADKAIERGCSVIYVALNGAYAGYILTVFCPLRSCFRKGQNFSATVRMSIYAFIAYCLLITHTPICIISLYQYGYRKESLVMANKSAAPY